MCKFRFTENQFIAVLKSVEAGRTVKNVCREAVKCEASYNNWKAKLKGHKRLKLKDERPEMR